jgi:hypothetical protein
MPRKVKQKQKTSEAKTAKANKAEGNGRKKAENRAGVYACEGSTFPPSFFSAVIL